MGETRYERVLGGGSQMRERDKGCLERLLFNSQRNQTSPSAPEAEMRANVRAQKVAAPPSLGAGRKSYRAIRDNVERERVGGLAGRMVSYDANESSVADVVRRCVVSRELICDN